MIKKFDFKSRHEPAFIKVSVAGNYSLWLWPFALRHWCQAETLRSKNGQVRWSPSISEGLSFTCLPYFLGCWDLILPPHSIQQHSTWNAWGHFGGFLAIFAIVGARIYHSFPRCLVPHIDPSITKLSILWSKRTLAPKRSQLLAVNASALSL